MSGRILIAEDEEQIVSFLEKGLRAAGYSTAVAPDGVSALVKALSGEFDLLILDIGLPGKDGFEVLHEIRDRGRDLPVLILTARGSTRDVVAGLTAGRTTTCGSRSRSTSSSRGSAPACEGIELRNRPRSRSDT